MGAQIISRKNIDAAIFDLDGVITKTARVHAAAWKQMFDEFLRKSKSGKEFQPFSDNDYRLYVDGLPRYEGVKRFLQSRNIQLPFGKPGDPPDAETVCGLGNHKNEIFRLKIKEKGVEVFPSSVKLIRGMRRTGFRTAVVSSSKNCRRVLDAAGLTELFDVEVDGKDAVALDLKGKPDPDIFLEAARRLEVSPDRCAVFEDAVVGVKAGSRGNFRTVIGVDRAEQSQELKDAGADFVVKDLAEIEISTRIEDVPDALESIATILHCVGQCELAVFLDYDGTLTPIVPRPEDALLPNSMRKKLQALSALCPVGILSGRGLQDVQNLVGVKDFYYAGSHGFEIAGPDDLRMENDEAQKLLPALDQAEQKLKQDLRGIPGAQVERKRFSIAIHYRNVAPDDVGEVEAAVDDVIRLRTGFRKTHGKKVFEVQPNVQWDKGRALLWLMDQLDLHGPKFLPIYIGDDITDEDAFRVLEGTGLGIVVGEGDRETAACYRLKNPQEVGDFLTALTKIIQERSEWTLVFEGFDPGAEGLREALCAMGNGYFVTRGAMPESNADDFHYPGTYLAGGYNRLKTVLAGKTIENEDLVNLPNWLSLRFRIAGEEFDLQNVEVLSYRQLLDMRNGVLSRELHFRTNGNRETQVLQRCFVSMSDMHLAALETSIVPLNWSGMLEVRSALDGLVTNSGVPRYRAFNSKHLGPEETKTDQATILLKMQTSQSGLMIAQAAKIEVFLNDLPATIEIQTDEQPGYIAHVFATELKQGQTMTIEKIISLFTSRDPATTECGMEAVQHLEGAGRFARLLARHHLSWKHLWRKFDIRLRFDGDDWGLDIRRTLRLYTFHLLQSASMHSLDIDVGMPARGWHGEAYRGHIFWDELIIFPFLNYRAPHIIRSLLMYRYRRLDKARQAAESLGYKGAMYPWQSGSNGREETQQIHLNPESGRWLPDNTHLQRHINASIVYNIWRYYQVSGDADFLSSYGAEMILEIARFWSSIASYNEALDRYEIRGIIGPDEFHDGYPDAETPGLNNNAYTNLMAVYVLNKALELFGLLPEQECRQLCERLGIEESEKLRWMDIARKMRIVFHNDGIISQFEGYENLKEFDWEACRKKYKNIQRLDRILESEGDSVNRYKASKQADVLMLFYLFSTEELVELFDQLGYTFDPEQIPRNVDYYLQRTSNGSSLSWIIHSWVASRRNRTSSWELFLQALKTDLADIQGGTTAEGIHLGAMAGCVDLVQRCFTGLESRGAVLRFNPQFPEPMKNIRMHIRFQGHWLDVDISSHKLRITSLAGSALPIEIDVQGTRFQIEEGRAREITLHQ